MEKLSSMFFCIVTDYYPRGSLDAYLAVLHARNQVLSESVSLISDRLDDDDDDGG